MSEPSARPARLHPWSILFLLGSSLRGLAAPAVAAIVFSGRGTAFWVPVALAVSTSVATVRYLSYRYRLGDAQLTVRQGILFRSERHVPYARIQNLNLVRNPFHRWLGVAEVHVETAGGAKPEAILRVLAIDAVDELRRRVFADRAAVADAAEDGGRELARMSPRDVALFGFLSNRGMVLVAAAAGALWQMVPDDLVGGWAETAARRASGWLEGLPLPELPGRAVSVALAIAGVVVALAALRALSIAWGFLRFHGFVLRRVGEDLRAEYGLLTRITATVPRRRVQLFHVRSGFLQRRLHAATVQVETAGGTGHGGGGDDDDRRGVEHVWLAPLIDDSRVEALREEALPGAGIAEADWRPLSRRAFARLARRRAIVAGLASAATAGVVGAWAAAVGAVAIALAVVSARLSVRHARWAVTGSAVAYRSGWWVRRTSIVPFSRIQAVERVESPFDRRRAMAGVAIDTAGAGRVGHRVAVPYLDREVADDLFRRAVAGAESTSFRW